MLPPIQPTYQPAQVVVPAAKPVGQIDRINPDRDPSSRHDHQHRKDHSGSNGATQAVEDNSRTPTAPTRNNDHQIDVWAGSASYNEPTVRIFL